MFDPLSLLIGVAGIAFIVYAFSTMKVFNRNARLIGISILMAVLILLGNRLLSPDRRALLPDNLIPRTTPEETVPRDSLPYDTSPWPNPFRRDPDSAPRLQPGWEDAPYVILELILGELAGAGNSSETPIIPTPTTPASPPPSIAPASPTPASPTPASPAPSPRPTQPTPTPASPTPSPTPPFDYSNPEFDPSPAPIPARPTEPPPQIPSRPYPPSRPSRPQPVPAWW